MNDKVIWYKRQGKAHKSPIVAIHRNGRLSINPEAAKQCFWNVQHVELGYIPEKKQVIFKVVQKSTRNSFKISKNKYTWGICCKSFVDANKIHYRRVRKFIPRKENNLIVIDLQEEV